MATPMTLWYLCCQQLLQRSHQLGNMYLCNRKMITRFYIYVNLCRYTLKCTLQQYGCCTLPSVYSSSGHHSDGVVSAALEVSEGGLICCRVTELHGWLTTSLSMIGDTGCVEAVRSWSWTTPLPYYPNTWRIHDMNADLSGSGRGWGWWSYITVKASEL